jgi:hypothetical protein
MDDETGRRRPSRLPAVFVGAGVVYAFFAVTSIVGAGTSVGVGIAATVIATALYVMSALVWIALTVVAVSSARRSRVGAEPDRRSMRAIALVPPLGGMLLLAAAYVARMNGQPFLGGFEAMVITTAALVVLTQAFPSLGLGARVPASTTAPTPTQRQSSGGGGASS